MTQQHPATASILQQDDKKCGLGSVIGNLLAIVAVFAAAILNLWPILPSWNTGPLYVSPSGSDFNSGRSAAQPLATIQKAADLVSPGQTVLIMPGVYRESLRIRRGGKPGEPVVFKATEPGQVTISGEADQSLVESLEWTSEGDRIWSARTPWPIYHVVGDGENFYHVRWADGRGDNVYHWIGKTGRVDVLRGLMRRPHAFGAFTFEGDRLFVAFADGRSPQEHQLHLHRQVPRPYASWSLRTANAWVEASHLRFEGLRFYLGVGAGILLWNGHDVTVSDSAFTGAVAGVVNSPSINAADKLVVEHSHYHNYPQFLWGRNWLEGKEVYSHHTYSTLVSARGDGIVVRDNLITHAGDGIEVSTDDSNITQGVQLSRNLLVFGTDDAFELDGFAKRVSIKDNVIIDFTVSLGLSPVLAGPVLIRNNVFLGRQPEVLGAHFKLLNPWHGRPGKRGGPINNILVTGNTFTGNRLSWWMAQADNLRDIWIVANRFDRTPRENPWSPAVTDKGNTYNFTYPSTATAEEAPGINCLVVSQQGKAAFPVGASLLAKAGDREQARSYIHRFQHVCLLANACVSGQGELSKILTASDGASAGFVALDRLHGHTPPSRPGPRWMNLESSPATRGVPARFAQAMEHWKCD